MVRSLNMGSNLPSMVYRMAMLTQTRATMIANVGPRKSDDLIRSEIAQVVPNYQERWDRGLAAAWAPLMTSEEFKSIAQQKQSSPHMQKLVSLQMQAGASMRANSEASPIQAVGDVMNGALEKSGKPQ